VTGDFTLRASTKAPGVKKAKLVAKVPGSHFAAELGKTYTLHIKAKRGGGRKLETVVVLKACGA
jgi:hypothetical protein